MDCDELDPSGQYVETIWESEVEQRPCLENSVIGSIVAKVN